MIPKGRLRTYSSKSHRAAPLTAVEYEVMRILGLRVAARRQERGYSYRALSPEFGVSASTISRIEKGDVPSAAVLLKMLAYLDVDVAAAARAQQPLPTDP